MWCCFLQGETSLRMLGECTFETRHERNNSSRCWHRVFTLCVCSLVFLCLASMFFARCTATSIYSWSISTSTHSRSCPGCGVVLTPAPKAAQSARYVDLHTDRQAHRRAAPSAAYRREHQSLGGDFPAFTGGHLQPDGLVDAYIYTH